MEFLLLSVPLHLPIATYSQLILLSLELLYR